MKLQKPSAAGSRSRPAVEAATENVRLRAEISRLKQEIASLKGDGPESLVESAPADTHTLTLAQPDAGCACVMGVGRRFAPIPPPQLPGDGAAFCWLFELNPCPMFIFDAATLQFLTVNEAAVRLYGWSRAEFLGMTLAHIRPPADVPRLLQAVANPRERHATSVGE